MSSEPSIRLSHYRPTAVRPGRRTIDWATLLMAPKPSTRGPGDVAVLCELAFAYSERVVPTQVGFDKPLTSEIWTAISGSKSASDAREKSTWLLT